MGRILTTDFHLGYINFGKSKRKNKYERIPEDQWMKVKGIHEAIKTQEEHDAIVIRYINGKRKRAKVLARTLPLSGLMYCERCGSVMGIFKHHLANGELKYRTRCLNHNNNPTSCKQPSTEISKEFLDTIYQKITHIDEEALNKMKKEQKGLNQSQSMLKMKEQELNKVKQALSKLMDMYEEGHINKETFLERKAKRDQQIFDITTEIRILRQQVNEQQNSCTVNSVMERIKIFKENWYKTTTGKEKNQLLQSIVDKIEYNCINKIITLKVHYH